MATVRLRRVFRYPEDSDTEHDREELDEEGLIYIFLSLSLSLSLSLYIYIILII